MGATIKLFCIKCGHQQRLFVGCGFRHDATFIFYKNMFRLRMMVESPEERVRIRDILCSHPDAEVVRSESRIYRCPYCGNLHTNYYFKIVYGNEEYLPCYYCSRCETAMEPLHTNWLTTCNSEPFEFFNSKGQKIELCCPHCGSKEFNCKEEDVDWD